jgi:hypothetical protein
MLTPRIQKAIDIFLDALNEGTLSKGSCSTCAVGNLCNGDNSWNQLFVTIQEENGEYFQELNSYTKEPDKNYKKILLEKAKKAISKTDFLLQELAQIEYAFETNTKIHWTCYFYFSSEQIRQDQINGLKAVIEVMMTFDDCKEDVE